MKALSRCAALYLGLLCLASVAFAQATPAAPASSPTAVPFAIHDGDHVVLYGDSITDQRLYSTFIEEYVLTRYPGWRIDWVQSGVGGDKVSGGSAGPIDLRIQRDILPYKPTVVTIMLGMNDGYYRPLNAAVQKTYEDGYKSMVNTILAGAPGAHLTLLGPSPYDDVTLPSMHYNEVMQAYSQFDRAEADATHQDFIDLNAPVVAVLEKVKASNPELAGSLVPDRVHPGSGVHWVMAAAVLKGWHAPSLVSSVAIDAGSAKATSQQNASVTGVKHDKKSGALEWTALESALPLPLPPGTSDPITNLALDAGGIEESLDQETLIVSGLKSGSYALLIDNQTVGAFSADALASGLRLARLDTPMLRQSLLLAADTERRNELERRLFSMKGGSQHGEIAPDAVRQAMQQAVSASIAQQQKDAQPTAHVFQLKPAQ